MISVHPNNISEKVGRFDGKASEEELHNWQNEKDQITNQNFLLWAQYHPSRKSEVVDPDYKPYSIYKVQWDGLTDNGDLRVRINCTSTRIFEDTIENRRYILECHDYYMKCVFLINSIKHNEYNPNKLH